uniref:ubiquitinyl hydrolase 1 n=1 Tax=Proboscia inermis TaxID=420281 RepID=A0A7S0C949_9STRA|mmetsp:Transcript_35102/g.35317  ORF Transcript_35102/g.35317 Transcript_35102/m.35317 type:complete len:337 (+) Transcript_35102:23-1033(+)
MTPWIFSFDMPNDDTSVNANITTERAPESSIDSSNVITALENNDDGKVVQPNVNVPSSGVVDAESHRIKREQTENQLNAINEEIRQNNALTSEFLPLTHLIQSYAESSESFLKGAEYLSLKYRWYRRVRGDGNCYYRAFLYGLCEVLLSRRLEAATIGEEALQKSRKDIDRVHLVAKTSLEKCTQQGYSKFTLEMFYDEFVGILSSLLKDTTTPASLHSILNHENGVSDYCCWYLRVLTATQLKIDRERFSAFLEYGDVDTFCSEEVEPMHKDVGMVQAIALAEFMGVKVDVEYLDGRNPDGKLVVHHFGPQDQNESNGCGVTLLYRPGHYDILYR